MIQLIIDGIVYGSIFALLGFAISAVFMTTGVVNFAIGESITFSMYVTYLTIVYFSIPYPVIILEVLLLTMVITYLISRFIIQPLLPYGHLIATIGTASMFIILPILTINLDTQSRKFPNPSMDFLKNSFVSSWDLTIIIVSAIIAMGLYLFVMRSNWGIGIRAIKSNQDSAISIGLPVNKIFFITVGISGLVAGIVGLLAAPKLLLAPNFMFPPFIAAIAGAVLGGLRNPMGVYVGCLLMGIFQSLAGGYFGNIAHEVIPILLILLVLILKPEGLFSKKSETRV
ncbi:branched-chain amino acid ABC transporter permease [Bacillus sp. JJ1533]|uniref:branched-chain amino acid ABC transporter permease n=1 Tax=Bacillus sp. JJ1533 TaxID=3122959 RepID=UPI002FFF91A7